MKRTVVVLLVLLSAAFSQINNPPTGGSGSGTVSANNGSAGANAFYSAAGGSTTVSPDATLNDSGTVLTYSGTSMTVPVGSATACSICFTNGQGISNPVASATGFFASNAAAANAALRFYRWTGAAYVLSGQLSFNQAGGNPSGMNLLSNENSNNQPMLFAGKMGQSPGPVVTLGGNSDNNATDFKAASGAQAGVSIGTAAGTGIGALNFSPTSGTATFTAFQVQSTINQTGGANGNYTLALFNATETAVGGAGRLVDVQVGGATKFAVNNKGNIFTAGTNSVASTVTVSASTTATITFTNSFTSTPVCVLTPQTTGLTSWFLSAISNTAFTVTVAPSGTYTFGYICLGNPN